MCDAAPRALAKCAFAVAPFQWRLQSARQHPPAQVFRRFVTCPLVLIQNQWKTEKFLTLVVRILRLINLMQVRNQENQP